jgi:hypothetical protein
MVLQVCYNGITKVLQGCCKDVTRVYLSEATREEACTVRRHHLRVRRMLQKRYGGVPRMSQRVLRGISEMFQLLAKVLQKTKERCYSVALMCVSV